MSRARALVNAAFGSMRARVALARAALLLASTQDTFAWASTAFMKVAEPFA